MSFINQNANFFYKSYSQILLWCCAILVFVMSVWYTVQMVQIREHLQIIRSKSETERFSIFARLQNPFLI
jgi:hypothetical protein